MQMFFAGIASAALLVASVAFTSSTPFFGHKDDNNQSGLTLDWQRQVQPSNCTPQPVRHGDDDRTGGPIINVVERVKNDADSGVAGNYWAMDKFSRRIQVWRTATSTYCAVVTYEGSFRAIGGQITPAGTSTLTGNEKGSIQGGYRATIVGTLLATSSWPTKGSVGEIDYACDASGNCPGYVNWLTQYFTPSTTQNLDWWGWIYRGGKYGTWINAISGNQGNIISSASSADKKSDRGSDSQE